MNKLNNGDVTCSNCNRKFTGARYVTYDGSGGWDGESYHCDICRRYFNYSTGKFSEVPEGVKIGGHKNTICSDCNSNSTNSGWYKRRDKDGNWDRRSYICNACYCNSAYRSGELNPNSNTYKGMVCVQTVAKVLGYKDCTIMKEGSPFDICSIQSLEYGKIEVKAATYNLIYKHWVVSGIKPGLFDTLFILCVDNEFENLVRIYIISGTEVSNISGITIIENLSYGSMYEKFRINDIIQYQEVFKIVKDGSQISKNYISNDQDSISNNEKGDICEEIVGMVINARISTDIRYDLIHEIYKKIEVKGSNYHSRHKCWVISKIKPPKFDTLFIICMNSNFEEVERVYIIPKKDVCNRCTVTIIKDPLRHGWHEEFRVGDIIQYQEACKEILSSNKI